MITNTLNWSSALQWNDLALNLVWKLVFSIAPTSIINEFIYRSQTPSHMFDANRVIVKQSLSMKSGWRVESVFFKTHFPYSP